MLELKLNHVSKRGPRCLCEFDSDLYSALFIAVMYPISCYIELRYNGTQLYLHYKYYATWSFNHINIHFKYQAKRNMKDN